MNKLYFTLLNISYASLTDNGDGTVYDSTLDITWLKDANQLQTSCDANDSLWQAFEPTIIANSSGRSKSEICNDFVFSNGVRLVGLNWYEAIEWIRILNSQNYKGHNDWRLPDVKFPDQTCGNFSWGGGFLTALGCQTGELGNLYYATLSNTHPTNDNLCQTEEPNGCFQNTEPFNITFPSWIYWYEQKVTIGDVENAFTFQTNGGFTIANIPTQGRPDIKVWPVYPGGNITTPLHIIPILQLLLLDDDS